MDKFFSKVASSVSKIAGKPVTFIVATICILIWAMTGPLFHFSETWQLIVNTSTTIITFLMLFVVQNSQNRDGLAIQAKLDELLCATDAARDDLMRVESLTEKEIQEIRK